MSLQEGGHIRDPLPWATHGLAGRDGGKPGADPSSALGRAASELRALHRPLLYSVPALPGAGVRWGLQKQVMWSRTTPRAPAGSVRAGRSYLGVVSQAPCWR